VNVAGWRAWYADGATYRTGDELPADGCVGVVVYYDAPYRDVVTGGDWYVIAPCGRVAKKVGRPDGTWTDPPGTAPDDVLVRSAPSLPDGEWARVQAEMMEARSWP